MTKPQMIRADTIDLQDQSSPSAKDHTRRPTSPVPIGDGPPAPHQAASLKHASLDGHELNTRSPRASQDLSSKELQLLHDVHSDVDEQDATEIEQSLVAQRNGDMGGQDGDMDGEDDESLDDDMMDKISSSPSIDDGGYRRPGPWPARGDSLFSTPPRFAPRMSADCSDLSSSPYDSTPAHLPLAYSQKEEDCESEDHHIPGKYPEEPLLPPPRPPLASPPKARPLPSLLANLIREDSMESRDKITPLVSEEILKSYKEKEANGGAYDDDFEGTITGLEGLLVPINDPLLDNSFDSGTVGSDEEPECDAPGQQDEAYDENEDDADDIFFEDSRFVDSGWGGECLREAEDIDFEFVYALHTFVATVEGQANATKGDTMVLLDDSNSYWWLVRVVKDSSIGYLPAEHIETPTERLARLNKHRNIDLSQTMLGDNPEKSRNPLKKAMRRRNAKTVQFSEPTYYEASENEYSTEEENDDELEYSSNSDTVREDAQAQHQQQGQNDSAHVEPLNVNRSGQRDIATDDHVSDSTTLVSDMNGDREDRPRTSSEMLEAQQDESNQPRSGRRMRNTDSFYKDDSIETRKITLTPNLLREDNSSGPNTNLVQDPKARGSLEGSEKQGSIEKTKDEKRKEKKPSKFSNIFKRSKDKKGKAAEDDEDWLNKDSRSSGQQSPQPKVSSDNVSLESQGQSSPQKAHPSRQSSKLQKAPPSKQNSLRRPASREDQQLARQPQQPQQIQQIQQAQQVQSAQPRPEPLASTAPRVESALIPDGALKNPFEDPEAMEAEPQQQHPRPPIQIVPSDKSVNPTDTTEFASPQSESSLRNVFSPIRDALRPAQPAAVAEPPKAERVKKAKNRMALDESDTSSDEHPGASSFPAAPLRQPADPYPSSSPTKDRLSESPVQVSPVVAPAHLPPLVGDTSSHSSDAVSPVSPSSTPELVERPTDAPPYAMARNASFGMPTPQPPGAFPQPPLSSLQTTPPSQLQTQMQAYFPQHPAAAESASASTTPVSSRTQHEWSDAHLRQYLETAQDEIRDLLLVVGDTSEVKVGKDNAVVRSFEGDRERFREMEKRLDRMVVELCARNGL